MRPGVEDVIARFFWLVSMLSRLDLPTLLRPTMATFGRGGRFAVWATFVALVTNFADFICSL